MTRTSRFPAVEVGARYGRLTVVSEAPRRRSRNASRRYWKCRCDCGNAIEAADMNLKTQQILSCKCLSRENTATRRRSHGASRTPLYEIWVGMIARCRRTTSTSYPYYGGRGIKVHDAWADDFAAFQRDVGARPSADHSLERVNVDGDYEPSNVTWVLRREQVRNQRRTRWVIYQGRRMCLKEATDIIGMSYGTVLSRIQSGWPEERWFEPARPSRIAK
jgi:hypothetical protein